MFVKIDGKAAILIGSSLLLLAAALVAPDTVGQFTTTILDAITGAVDGALASV